MLHFAANDLFKLKNHLFLFFASHRYRVDVMIPVFFSGAQPAYSGVTYPAEKVFFLTLVNL